MIVQYLVVILVLSQEEIERTYFYSAILNWKPCFLFIFQILFIYFWLCWVFFTMPRLSLVMATRGYSLAEVSELLLVEL